VAVCASTGFIPLKLEKRGLGGYSGEGATKVRAAAMLQWLVWPAKGSVEGTMGMVYYEGIRGLWEICR